MPVYVHYDPETKAILSYQEAPEGQQDETPEGAKTIKVDHLSAAKSVLDNQ